MAPFQRVGHKWINPLSGKPFLKGEFFVGRMFHMHSKKEPKFFLDGIDRVGGLWINPTTQKPFCQGDEWQELVFVSQDRSRKDPRFVSKDKYQRQIANVRHRRTGMTRSLGSVMTLLLGEARRRAKKRQAKMTLTKEWLLPKLEKGVCEMTGIPFQLGIRESNTRSGYAPSLDRIDSNNYDQTPENTRVVLDYVNSALNRFSIADSSIILRAFLNGLQA